MPRKKAKWKQDSEESHVIASCEGDYCDHPNRDSTDANDEEENNYASDWDSSGDEVMADNKRKLLSPQVSRIRLESLTRTESVSGVILDIGSEQVCGVIE